MNLLFLIILGAVLLTAGYLIYGRILSRLFRLSTENKSPACEFKDDIDFVPTNKFYLLGQHLSAIAAAGPIIGPILAGMWFGWLPTMLWIILGGIFIGGVHDMASIVASMRHCGKSIAEVIRDNMSRKAFILFLLFLWFSLIYIITAFTDITASTFVEKNLGPQVASSSMMYLLLAFVMGITIRLTKINLLASTLIFLPLVFVCIYLGPLFPLKISAFAGMDLRMSWDVLLLVYCFFASIIPVWLLLQPRGYLGGFFLTFTTLITFLGIAVGSFFQKFSVQYPALVSWNTPQGFPLLPLLFTTVACGACSGFHAVVASGTTSKQIAKEPDARLIGYGGMLLESFVALIALSTLLILTQGQVQNLKDPNQIYAQGIGVFLNSLGINKNFAVNFALLAFATFVYDTLDVATRLGRYIFQELFNFKSRLSPYIATSLTLLFPLALLTRQTKDAGGNVIPAWKLFWTVFGSSNQLLAAIVLLTLSVWMFKKKMRFLITLLPSIFMMVIAVVSLFIIFKPMLNKIILNNDYSESPAIITVGILLSLALLLIIETLRIFQKGKAKIFRK